MEPTTARYINSTWYELCDTAAWQKMMRRVDQGLPPTEEGDVSALETSPDNGETDYSSVVVNNNAQSTSSDYSYEEPTYYEEETYEEPTYEEETYEEPTYEEEPVYEEPTYEESTEE